MTFDWQTFAKYQDKIKRNDGRMTFGWQTFVWYQNKVKGASMPKCFWLTDNCQVTKNIRCNQCQMAFCWQNFAWVPRQVNVGIKAKT